MPSGIISHQAPGLFLKVKYPYKFDGTALCFGTLVPDLNVLINPFLSFSIRPITHSLLGLIVYTIPLTIILSTIFCSFVAPIIAKIAKREGKIYKPLKYFGLDDWDNLKIKNFDKRYYLVAFYSALIGGLTHILLDIPAHSAIDIFFPVIIPSPDFLLYSIVDFGPITIGPFAIERNLTIYQLIWIIEDPILLISTIYLLRYIKKHNLITKWYNENSLR